MTLLESGPHIREQLEGLPMSSLVDVLSWLVDLLVPKELPSTHTPSTLTHSSCYTPSTHVRALLGTARDGNPTCRVRYREMGGRSHVRRTHSGRWMGLSPLAV